MRVDHVGVDFMGIDLVAPNPCFVKYVHYSQNPNQHNLLDSVYSKISSFSLCNCSKLRVGRGVMSPEPPVQNALVT